MRKSLAHRPRSRIGLAASWLAAAALLVGMANVSPATAAKEALTTVDIYMSTTGDDGNDGSESLPVKSLARARDLVEAAGTDQATIHVDDGTYFERETIIWDGVPQDRVLVRPIGTGRPVFDGSNVPVVDTGRHSWMRTGEHEPGPSLDVRGMTVRNYGTSALRLYHVDRNVVRNMIFENLGNRHIPGVSGYAALHVTDSNNNIFVNNIYRNLENDDCPGCIHAIYPSQSSNNVIADSTMEYITGDPVRLRNGSSNNAIHHNTFRNNSFPAHPQRAMVSFWLFEVAALDFTFTR